MAYTNVFGGQLLFPAQLSYLAITTAVDVTLQWPTEQQIGGTNIVADFLDINTTAVALNVDFPDARISSTGNKTTVNNVGANQFTVRDNTGGVIQVIGPGQQWVIVLTDNSTQAGTWSSFQLGAATTFASAAALAGAGMQADGFGMLELIIDSDVEAATPVTVVDGDRAKCLIYTAGAGTANLPSPGTVGNNWFFMLRNSGTGTLNVVPPAGVIDGGASINLDPNDSAFIFTDGTDFFTVGLSSGSTIAFDFVSIPVPGSGDFVLSGANLNRIAYRFTGALTGNRNIVVPTTTQQYWVDNQTTGAFTLSIKTAAQVTPPTLGQGDTAIFYCDATDVINAVSTVAVVFPISISQGGTSATTAAGARTNLQAAFDGRLINSGAGLSGGGDLTADRTLILDINSANTTPTPAPGDFVAFEDIDDNLTYKATIQDVVDAATTEPSELFFSGASVLEAISTSAVDLKSAGNTDAEPRELRFTRNDGTIALFVGQDLFSEEFDIENRINVADAQIRISTTNANAEILLRPAGATRLEVSGLGPIARGSAANNSIYRLGDNTTLTRGQIGYRSTNNLDIDNSVDSGLVRIFAQDSLSVERQLFEGNPNGDVALFHNPGGGAIEVARTLDDGAGGFEVNNQLTGAGFERVITESDIGAGQVIEKVKNVSTTRGVTGVSNDPELSGWALTAGYWRFYGSFTFTVTPSNGGIDLNWSTIGGTLGIDFGTILTRDDTGLSVGGCIEGAFIPSNVSDLTITYAVRNDQTRAFIHGQIEVASGTVTVGFQWAPRLAANMTVGEGSWIRFQKMN